MGVGHLEQPGRSNLAIDAQQVCENAPLAIDFAPLEIRSWDCLIRIDRRDRFGEEFQSPILLEECFAAETNGKIAPWHVFCRLGTVAPLDSVFFPQPWIARSGGLREQLNQTVDPFPRILPMTKTVEATKREAIGQVIAQREANALETEAPIDETPIALQFVKDLGGIDKARRALDDLERILRN